ncbi:MAG TPA: hypothetical protein VI758_03700 [Bacteroidota bacterium]
MLDGIVVDVLQMIQAIVFVTNNVVAKRRLPFEFGKIVMDPVALDESLVEVRENPDHCRR